MKHFRPLRPFSLAAVLVLASVPLFAAEVAPADAGRAARAWVDRGYAMGKLPAGRTVADVDEIEDPATGARLLVAKFEGGGFVVLSADDLVDPVLAFSETGDGIDLDENNPGWILLRADIAAREAAAGVARDEPAPTGADGGRGGAAPAPPTEAQRKWADLLSEEEEALPAAGTGVDSISDVRVDSFIQSSWNQKTSDNYSGSTLTCYNYYTPNNYYCGCTATATAQIMRYYRFPTGSVTPKTWSCKVGRPGRVPLPLGRVLRGLGRRRIRLRRHGRLPRVRRAGRLLHDPVLLAPRRILGFPDSRVPADRQPALHPSIFTGRGAAAHLL